MAEVVEADGSSLGTLGWIIAGSSQLNQGEREGLASQGPDDGEYVVRFQVHA